MTTRDTLRSLISDFLPLGPFWAGEAGDRFVDGLTDALEDVAVTADGLRDAIFPGTASRDVLLQWWLYIDTLGCLPVPADTEELRSAVLLLLTAADIDTPGGLAARIHAFLPFVDVRESLAVSWVPSEVPFEVEPTGRILEIWYPPTKHSAAQVTCIAQPYQRAADQLRIVAPAAEWYTTGGTAATNALSWVYGGNCSLYVEYSDSVGGAAIDFTTYVLPTQHGVVTIESLFAGLDAADTILEREFRWYFQKDLGAGDEKITATETQYLMATPAEIWASLAQLTFAGGNGWLWVADSQDYIQSEDLVQVGSAAENQATTGLYEFDGAAALAMGFAAGTEGWEADDTTTLDLSGSTIFVMVFRTTNGLPGATVNVFGDRDSGTGDGAEINIMPSASKGVLQWNVGTTFRQTGGSNDYADDAWHVVAVRYDAATPDIDMATELETVAATAFTGNSQSASRKATIGRGRLSTTDWQCAAFAAFVGSQVLSADIRAICDRAYKYLVEP